MFHKHHVSMSYVKQQISKDTAQLMNHMTWCCLQTVFLNSHVSLIWFNYCLDTPLGTIANLTALDKHAKVAIIKLLFLTQTLVQKGIRVESYRSLMVHTVIEPMINSSLSLSIRNCTYNIICMLRCILNSMSVSHVHWAYTIRVLVYLLHKCLT